MSRSVLPLFFGFLLLSLTGCSESAVVEPEASSLLPQPQFSTQAVKGAWFSDYLPDVPGLYGVKTYQGDDGLITSRLVGMETVPYDPPITGIKMTFGEESIVFRNQGKEMWWLSIGGYVFSRSCGSYSPYPESVIIGYLEDGMILDRTGGDPLWLVSESDPDDCVELNTGFGDSYVSLIQIQDVRLPDRHVSGKWPDVKDEDFKWHTYKDAILTWELEPNRPDLQFKLDFDGLDQLLGIQLPTAEDTNNWAIDDLMIWGRNVGILLTGDISLDTGEFEVGWFLTSETHAPER